MLDRVRTRLVTCEQGLQLALELWKCSHRPCMCSLQKISINLLCTRYFLFTLKSWHKIFWWLRQTNFVQYKYKSSAMSYSLPCCVCIYWRMLTRFLMAARWDAVRPRASVTDRRALSSWYSRTNCSKSPASAACKYQKFVIHGTHESIKVPKSEFQLIFWNLLIKSSQQLKPFTESNERDKIKNSFYFYFLQFHFSTLLPFQ